MKTPGREFASIPRQPYLVRPMETQCCDSMKFWLEASRADGSTGSENPVIRFDEQTHRYWQMARDDTTCTIPLHFCPWCGIRLAEMGSRNSLMTGRPMGAAVTYADRRR
jgi:hypothetical protein